MKGFTKIMLIVASVAIGILVVVVASVAWFTSNPEVDANEVTLTSANTLVVTFDETLYESNYRYDGQDGVVEDAFRYPYGYFKANLSNSAPEKRSVIKLDFSTVDMECPRCVARDLLIENLFQVEIACYVEDEEGTYSLSSESGNANYNVFREGGDGGYRRIADDYTLDSENYLYRSGSRVQFEGGVYYLAFTFVFLPASEGGYVADDDGDYLGLISYRQIASNSQTTYDYTGSGYAVNESGKGEYSKIVTGYQLISAAERFDDNGDSDPNGAYIQVKDHNGTAMSEYDEFETFSYVDGFPFADISYQGATYSFKIVCSVEEV